MRKFVFKLNHGKKLLVSLFLLGSLSYAQAQTLAFPGALGFGRNATGGRTGTVYHVTNLNDSGTGSFRDAVSASNRIVVFDVGGYITLTTAVSVSSNITIAGQTAPGGGIGFKSGEIGFSSSTNIICRYIRVRPGSETASTTDDAISFYRATNMILDHSSIQFAPWNDIDGVTDDWQNHPLNNITVQNCIIADPTGQQFGAHTEAVNGNWAWFYNIFANSHNRNPLAKVNTIFVNNVLYNCSAGYTTHTSTNFDHDIVNNYFIFGPASAGTDNTWYQVDKNQSIYYSGNLKDTNDDGTLNGATTTPFWYQGPGTILTSPWSPLTTTVAPLNTQTAYRYAVSRAGALPRDQVDALVISQVKTLGSGTTGTGAGTTGPDGTLYTSQTQTGLGNNGYGTISSGTKPTDTDNDGMPDFWETANGLSTTTNDAMTIATDGYANIEHYINWLADPHATTTKNNFVDVDLSIFAGGFSSVSPTYSASSASHGTISLTSHTVRFTPTTNFTGLGSFNFTVSGSDGSTYSSKVTIVVSTIASGLPIFATMVGGGAGGNTTSTDKPGTANDLITKKAAIVYPNPASNLINLKLTGYTGAQYNLNLVDISGRSISKTSVKANADNVYQIRLNSKPLPGEYILMIDDAGHTESIKVMIQ